MKNWYTSSKQTVVRAYHGTSKLFKKFDVEYAPQGVFWFTTDIEEIKDGRAGAVSTKYILVVDLTIKEHAGWEEYERDFLEQIKANGYNSIFLDNNIVMFETKDINIVGFFERMSDGKYSEFRKL